LSSVRSIKKQGFWFTFAIIGFAFMSVVGVFYFLLQSRIDDTNQINLNKIQDAYSKNVDQHLQGYYEKKAEQFLSKEVIDAVESKDRIKLEKLILEDFQKLQCEDIYIKQLHFHLANGFTLYRAHKPNFFDDNIALLRPMVKKVHSEKKLIAGFEDGKNGLSYRIFVPIFKNNNYLGALEIGVSPQKLLDMITYFNNLDGVMNLEKSSLQHNAKNMIFSQLKDSQLVENFSFDFEKSCEITFKDKKVIANKLDMVDFSHHKIGEFVFFTDVTKEYEYIYRELISIIAIFLIIFVLFQVAINFIFSKLIFNLNKTSSELETILHTSRDGIAILDLETNFLFFNDSYLKMTGFTKEELLTKSCAALSTPEDLPRAIKAVEIALETGYVENFEKTCIVKDSKRVMINMSIALMPDKKRILITTKDITESKKIQKQIENYVKLIDENIITSSTNLDGTILSASQAFCEISEFSKEELIGQNHRIIRHPDMPKEIFEDMWEKIINDKVWEGEIKNTTKSCGFYWVHNKIYPIYDETNTKTGYTAIRQDITDKKIIEQISITDGLTNIFNRRHFNEIFPKVISSAKRDDALVCFLLMDIDHFKLYNDNYGHQGGDDVLIKFAACLKNTLHRVGDLPFRLGGEEFGIIFKSETKEKALEFANQVRQNIENLHIEHSYNSASPYITASMGLVCQNGKSIKDMDEAYKEADDLLYMAKKSGRNRVMVNETYKDSDV